MTDLSPAAQAVLRAAGDSEPGIYATIAATLRAAAADQVVPEQECQIYGLTQQGQWLPRENERQQVREEILAIAAELEVSAWLAQQSNSITGQAWAEQLRIEAES